MREYIRNLTNDLLGNGCYTTLADDVITRQQLLEIIRTDLQEGAVRYMRPETLGRIMCSFDSEDIPSNHLGHEVMFAGDCNGMLRELVALALAYVIVGRLKPDADDLYTDKSARDRAHLKATDKIIESTLETALARYRRGRDIGSQLDLLMKNYEHRQEILNRET
jgi:hypothetical protein